MLRSWTVREIQSTRPCETCGGTKTEVRRDTRVSSYRRVSIRWSSCGTRDFRCTRTNARYLVSTILVKTARGQVDRKGVRTPSGGLPSQRDVRATVHGGHGCLADRRRHRPALLSTRRLPLWLHPGGKIFRRQTRPAIDHEPILLDRLARVREQQSGGTESGAIGRTATSGRERIS